ncbi:hypothetical protein D3C85_1341030 [compost metagenome]
MTLNTIPPYPLDELNKGQSKFDNWSVEMSETGNLIRYKLSNGDDVEVKDYEKDVFVTITNTAGSKDKIFNKYSIDIDDLFKFVDTI